MWVRSSIYDNALVSNSLSADWEFVTRWNSLTSVRGVLLTMTKMTLLLASIATVTTATDMDVIGNVTHTCVVIG